MHAAESCAKTCVKLSEMSRLLDELALAKVKEGDEAGAKSVLQEREALKDIIDKSSSKATANYALAGKLAEKIGLVQNDILQFTPPATPPSRSAPSAPPTRSAPAPEAPEEAYTSTPYAAYTSSSSAAGASTSGTGAFQTSYVPAWQKSLMVRRGRRMWPRHACF